MGNQTSQGESLTEDNKLSVQPSTKSQQYLLSQEQVKDTSSSETAPSPTFIMEDDELAHDMPPRANTRPYPSSHVKNTNKRKLHHNFERLQQEHHLLAQEKQVLEAREARSHCEIEDLRKENASLHIELRTCRDDLYKLLPASQIPDSEIIKQYRALDYSIRDWIESEILLSEAAASHKGVQADKQAFFAEENVLNGYLLHLYPNAEEYRLRSAIHTHLRECIFSKDKYLFGLTENFSDFLAAVEEGMVKLEPTRDIIKIRTWRSETLGSLLNSPTYHDMRTDATRNIAECLFNRLVPTFRILDPERGSRDRLLKEVIEPAAALAAVMQTSLSHYHFRDFVGGEYIRQEDLKNSHFKFIDIKSGKPLKGRRNLEVDEHGNIGKALIHVMPALIRRDKRHGRDIWLTDDVYAVELHQPTNIRSPEAIQKPGLGMEGSRTAGEA